MSALDTRRSMCINNCMDRRSAELYIKSLRGIFFRDAFFSGVSGETSDSFVYTYLIILSDALAFPDALYGSVRV